MMKKVLGCVLPFALLAGGSAALGKKRDWDVERYTQCLKVQGEDALAPDLIVTTEGCNDGRNPIVASEGLPNGLKALAWTAGARNKDNPALTFVAITYATRFERISTFINGAAVTSDNGGSLGLGSAYAIISGRREKLESTAGGNRRPECNFARRGTMSARTCAFTESAVVLLPAKLLDEVVAAHAADPNGVFRFRVETSGGSITFGVPLAEIVSVKLRIFAAK